MRNLPRIGAVLVAFIIVALAVGNEIVRASSGTTNDPKDTTGMDLKTAYHSETPADSTTPTKVTLGFSTYDPINSADVVTKWDFNLGVAGGQIDCMTLSFSGGTYKATLWDKGCDTTPFFTYSGSSVRTPTASSIEVDVPVADLQALGMPANATSYKYRLHNKNSQGMTDFVPDLPPGSNPINPDDQAKQPFITHTFGPASSSSPTPTPTPTASPHASTSPTPTASYSPSPSPSGSASPTPSPCPTATPTPTPSPTPYPSASPSASPIASPTASPTATPTASPKPTATPCASRSDNVTVVGTPSKTTAAPGDTVQIQGDGFTANASLAATFHSTPTTLGTITTNASGAFLATVTVPTDATNGSHNIVVVGPSGSGTRTITYPITVTSGASDTSGSSTSGSSGSSGSGSSSGVSLPRTGAGITGLLGAAVLLVLLGLNVTSESRRRRNGAQTQGPTIVEEVSGPPSDDLPEDRPSMDLLRGTRGSWSDPEA